MPSFADQSFDTRREAIIESAFVFLTAQGLNSKEQALQYHAEGPEANRREAEQGDTWEYADEWHKHWESVGERIEDAESL
jgi:hypothetical protein